MKIFLSAIVVSLEFFEFMCEDNHGNWYRQCIDNCASVQSKIEDDDVQCQYCDYGLCSSCIANKEFDEFDILLNTLLLNFIHDWPTDDEAKKIIDDFPSFEVSHTMLVTRLLKWTKEYLKGGFPLREVGAGEQAWTYLEKEDVKRLQTFLLTLDAHPPSYKSDDE